MALKRLCPKCNRVIEPTQKYCFDCQQKVNDFKKKQSKQYDTKVRNSTANKRFTAFYKSDPWQATRTFVINKYSFDIYEYYKTGKIVPAETVHHIEELKDNWNRRLDITNMIPVTLSNHSKIHLLYKRDKQRYQTLLFELLEKYKKEFDRP